MIDKRANKCPKCASTSRARKKTGLDERHHTWSLLTTLVTSERRRVCEGTNLFSLPTHHHCCLSRLARSGHAIASPQPIKPSDPYPTTAGPCAFSNDQGPFLISHLVPFRAAGCWLLTRTVMCFVRRLVSGPRTTRNLVGRCERPETLLSVVFGRCSQDDDSLGFME
jgi:hypothetical protein